MVNSCTFIFSPVTGSTYFASPYLKVGSGGELSTRHDSGMTGLSLISKNKSP